MGGWGGSFVVVVVVFFFLLLLLNLLPVLLLFFSLVFFVCLFVCFVFVFVSFCFVCMLLFCFEFYYCCCCCCCCTIRPENTLLTFCIAETVRSTAYQSSGEKNERLDKYVETFHRRNTYVTCTLELQVGPLYKLIFNDDSITQNI